jgi:hypothetical protein
VKLSNIKVGEIGEIEKLVEKLGTATNFFTDFSGGGHIPSGCPQFIY